MKKIFLKTISVILMTAVVISSTCIGVFAAEFGDLNGHWGYDYVMTIVNDGTVNGYPDGTFRPDGTVTRAEFVKLIGKTEVLYNGTYSDIEGHWGYDYIMYSGLDGYSDGTFKPDTPITRNDCVNLIWKRNGAVEGVSCPSAITNQGTNRDAVAWAYTYGIVCGDDGFNLRLSDTLTRAEAATLIVRARSINADTPKVSFIDRINPEILKVVFESYNIFGDIQYNADATITNGQLARAALAFGEKTTDIEYKVGLVAPYEGEYALDMATANKECMEDVPVTLEAQNAPASVKHAIAEFMYNTLKRCGRLKSGNGAAYQDMGTYSGNMDIFIKYAYKNNIMFDHTRCINPDKQITHKELAAILLQIDEVFGTQVSYVNGTQKFIKINKNLATYPANYKDYLCLLEGVSQKLYSEFKPEASTIEYTNNAHSAASVMGDTVKLIKGKYEKAGMDFTLTCYPTLMCEKNTSITFVVKMTANAPEGTMASSIFGDIYYSSKDADISKGDVYLVFKTTVPMFAFYFEPGELQIIDVIA